METLHTTTSGITPEKLSIMKLAELDRENGSEATATGPRSHLDALDSRSVVSRSGRRIRSSRRSSSTFISTHRNKMSLELTSKAEGKFLALMDLMASASREASSLKEFWARIVSERESFIAEREELLTRIDEITEDFEAREKHHHDHGHELGERKAQVEKLQTASGTKDKVTEYWIEKLLERGWDIKKKNPKLSEDELVNQVQKWFDAQPGDKMNPLLDITGMSISHTKSLEPLFGLWRTPHPIGRRA